MLLRILRKNRTIKMQTNNSHLAEVQPAAGTLDLLIMRQITQGLGGAKESEIWLKEARDNRDCPFDPLFLGLRYLGNAGGRNMDGISEGTGPPWLR